MVTHNDGVGAQQGGVPPQKLQLRRQQAFPVYYTETDGAQHQFIRRPRIPAVLLKVSSGLKTRPPQNNQQVDLRLNIVSPVAVGGSVTRLVVAVGVVVGGGELVTRPERERDETTDEL